jgi:hypothetical protein
MGADTDISRPALDAISLKARFKQLQQQTNNVYQLCKHRSLTHCTGQLAVAQVVGVQSYAAAFTLR